MGELEMYRGITWPTGSVSSVHYGGPLQGGPSPSENRHKIIRRTWLPNNLNWTNKIGPGVNWARSGEWSDARRRRTCKSSFTSMEVWLGADLRLWGGRKMEKWWWDCFFTSNRVLHGFILLWVLAKNMGGGQDGQWNNGDEVFTCCGPVGHLVGTQPVIHKLSVRHITDRLNSRDQI